MTEILILKQLRIIGMIYVSSIWQRARNFRGPNRAHVRHAYIGVMGQKIARRLIEAIMIFDLVFFRFYCFWIAVIFKLSSRARSTNSALRQYYLRNSVPSVID